MDYESKLFIYIYILKDKKEWTPLCNRQLLNDLSYVLTWLCDRINAEQALVLDTCARSPKQMSAKKLALTRKRTQVRGHGRLPSYTKATCEQAYLLTCCTRPCLPMLLPAVSFQLSCRKSCNGM